jgi:hypothetical protein
MFPNDSSYICSRQRYSTYIVLFRLAHLQQSSKLQCKHCSIPTCASAAVVKASHPLVFPYIRTHLITRYVVRLFFVYIMSSKLQYRHCSIQTCASAAVVKATVQTLFNLILLALSLSFSLSLSLSLSLPLLLLLSLSLSLSRSLSLSLSLMSAYCCSARLKLVHSRPFRLFLNSYDGVEMWKIYSL